MNWRLVFTLSLFGLAMSLLTVFLVPSKIEPMFWLVIFVVCAVVIARSVPERRFLHGLCTSLVNSVWITSGHLLFFETYLAGHPDEAAMLSQSAMSGRVMMALTGPVIGLASGVVLGLFALVAGRFVQPPAGVLK